MSLRSKFEENSAKRIICLSWRYAIVLEKHYFQDVFCPHENAKAESSNPSGLKTNSEKLRFLDGPMWTEGLRSLHWNRTYTEIFLKLCQLIV